jgi:hypothetical protein
MVSAEVGRNVKSLSVLLFLTLNFFYLLTSSGRVRTIDEVTLVFETESLATRGSTAIPQALPANLFFGKLDRTGRPQPAYPAGQALLSVPWYAAGRFFAAVLPGIPPQAKDAFLDAALTASSATFAALAAALFFAILLRIGISLKRAVASTLLVALATPLFAYSAWLFPEAVSAALLLAAALVLFSGGEVPIPPRQAILAGVVLGFVSWIRPTHVIVASIFVLAILIRDRSRGLGPAMLTGLIIGLFGGALVLRNLFLFGSLFDFGYPATAEGGKSILSFQTPLSTGLFGFLFSPGKSMFLFAPPILLAIPGLRRLAQRDLGLAIVAGTCPVLALFFFAKFAEWEGGYCVGPRYLLPGLILLCLGLGPMLEDGGRWPRPIARLLFVIGFCVQAVGMSTSFLEDQANGAYYDPHWTYRMEYAPLASQTRRLWHYATSSAAAPLGLGFDHWLVFLKKAGIAQTTLALILTIELAGFLFFAWRFKQALLNSRTG